MAIRWIKRKLFSKGLLDTEFFRKYVRPLAYLKARGNPEKVHELALESLVENEDILAETAAEFDFPALHINLAEREIMPFGTAAGLDKNADAVNPLSRVFGFQEVGTIVVQSRPGNKKPRVAVDRDNGNIYNAQGFPSEGYIYALRNISRHRASKRRSTILANITGIPSEDKGLEDAFLQIENILNALDKYVDGFVWNPFSPNTETLKLLRTPEIFRQYATRIRQTAGSRLVLTKMGPYEEKGREQWLELVRAFISGGGDGIVAVNTLKVPKSEVPSRRWGYDFAGVSGRCLQPYRQRAIIDTRKEFPDAVIIATGGIDSGEQAWLALEAGADALEGYTPYTFHGFGLIREMAKYIIDRLHEEGCGTLSEFKEKQKLSCKVSDT